MPRTPPPVSRFPQEMMQALVQGARSAVTIALPTRKDCTMLRQKFYMLRGAMKREAHYNMRIVERAEIVITPQDARRKSANDPHNLTIRPANVEYLGALHAAGIESNDELDDSESATVLPQQEIETQRPIQETDFLGILNKAKENTGNGEEDQDEQ